MTSQRISGMLLLAGSALFLTAAFLPVSRVFGERDAKLLVLQDLPPFTYYLITAATAIVFLRSP